MKRYILAAGVANLIALGTGPAWAEGDAAAGEKGFNACKACHTIEKGSPNRIGPNLHSVVGRKAGSVEGFQYSAAVKNSQITWDEVNLDTFLADPKGKIAGNKMAFAGVKNEKQRRDIIAYLQKQSK
ncbi:cytochrome c family protein (plasmid) [Skermanella mucosa]|nr:cytochrome c family protein [Skermanella mucosa]